MGKIKQMKIDIDYFLNPINIQHKQYEALRSYFVDGKTALEVARKFGYTYRAFTSLIAYYRNELSKDNEDPFFKEKKAGRKPGKDKADIKVVLDGKGKSISEKTIYNILRKEGFPRLPRRTKHIRQEMSEVKIKPDISAPISLEDESFSTNSAGLLCLLPYIREYGIDKAIFDSEYPGTERIDKFSSIMSFLALKLSSIRRYTKDDLWCMDRGLGLFAGLNVLPKASSLSSYSHRVTRDMNISFLRSLHAIWKENGLLGNTINLDFTAVPYWGNDEHLENNWSGKRNQSLSAMLAVIAQDQDSGIIDYGNADILHKQQDAVVLEFLDFYRSGDKSNNSLRYLVFDSKFTNYENLAKLDDQGIKFITIRRRGKNIIESINNIPASSWKKTRIPCSGNKKRTLNIHAENIVLKGYDRELRQIAITGHGKIKPALIITNDFDESVDHIVRKYARRWLVEKCISEQIEFFHLNRVSSSMVIKVDFDLTMSIVAHNIYRIFANDIERYSHLSDVSLFEKFIMNSGEVVISGDEIRVKLKKKKNLPLLLQTMNLYKHQKYGYFSYKNISFEGLSYS